MTEADWLAATDPTPMLKFIHGRVSVRKLRLFAVACARRVLPPDPDEDMLAALGVAERVADGEGTKHDLARARGLLKARHPERVARWSPLYASHIRTVPAWHACRGAAERAATEGSECCGWSAGRRYRNGLIGMAVPSWLPAEQAECLRCVFGNPYRPVTLDPAWLTSTVTALAGQMYDSRVFSAMPILADALQDAGCEDEGILKHCRGDGPHVRGCWAVDLVFGKE